jgi:hypothetical protein
MEIKIGIQHVQRELLVESSASAEEVEQQVASAIADGGLVTLTDSKDRKVLIPADRLAYVEIGGGVAGQVGFRS